MTTLTVTSKGQVTFRKDILAHLGVAPGQKIDVDKLPDGRIEVKAAPFAEQRGDISDLFGIAKRPGQRVVSIEEMNEVIRKGWAGQL